MEAREYGLTRGTCFLACRLELDAVAGLLWISWCVLGGADIFSVCFSSIIFFFERTRPAASMRPPCLICLSSSKIAARRNREQFFRDNAWEHIRDRTSEVSHQRHTGDGISEIRVSEIEYRRHIVRGIISQISYRRCSIGDRISEIRY